MEDDEGKAWFVELTMDSAFTGEAFSEVTFGNYFLLKDLARTTETHVAEVGVANKSFRRD